MRGETGRGSKHCHYDDPDPPLRRYLGLPTPEDNLRGYQASDVNSKAKKLANKKYLMVHGTADDNVHYQQSMMFSRALEEADVLFRWVETNRKYFANSVTITAGKSATQTRLMVWLD